MTTPPPPSRGVLAALAVVVALSALGAGAALIGRTLVPLAVDGTVVSIDARNRSPGTEIWIVNLADGDRLFVDDEAARAFRPGVVSKPAWSNRVRVGDTERTIGWSRDLLGPGTWVLLTVGWCAAGIFVVGRSGRERGVLPVEDDLSAGP